MYFACSPQKWVITNTCQVLVVWLRIHLLPFPSNQPQNGFLVSAYLVFWKELPGTRVSVYKWHTVKSTDLKWKRCSHICLLTFLLKRGGGLGGISVLLKVDWSVPALKSSQSVSSTVRCLIWWSWWNLYSLWHQHFRGCLWQPLYCSNFATAVWLHFTDICNYIYVCISYTLQLRCISSIYTEAQGITDI